MEKKRPVPPRSPEENRALLEPVLNDNQSRMRSVHKLLHPKPAITADIAKSNILVKVKKFLPQMAEADYALQSALRNGDNHMINIENVENDEKVIEMDVALLKEDCEEWTSDSEVDSSPSVTDNNDYTSDSDISSSSTCSSSSCSDNDNTRNGQSGVSAKNRGKRALIQDMDSQQQPSKFCRKDIS